MLLRHDERGVLAIGQPSHAWISGQLARAWGNDRFGELEPREEICLAAEQHDIGMAEWDLEPSFNPATGLPHGFTEMPLPVHLDLWTHAARRLLRQSRYAALLTSMHGVRLYQLRDLARLPPADADAVRAFFAEQQSFQRELRRSLRASDAQIARASDLLWTWDGFSLAICLDWAPWTAKRVPTADPDTSTDLSLSRNLATPDATTVDPWPFATEIVTVRAEGQRLDAAGYPDAGSLADALASAPWEPVSFRLVPPEGGRG